MQRKLCTICLLLFLVCAPTISQKDPCDSYQSIPDIHRRDASYRLSSGELSINDRELVAGWYGDTNMILLNQAPGFFKCGGWYPIWRSGPASMCVQSATDNCSETFNIEMKTCNSWYEVYYLPAAPVHRAAYCFEVNPDAPPHFNVTPTINVNLQNEMHMSKLLFSCDFTRSSEDLMYKTIWYVGGAPVYTFEPMKWTSDLFDYVSTTALTEDLLKENGITKAGFNLQCAVRAQYRLDSASSESVLSKNKFVGVKIHHWEIYAIAEGETRMLYVSLSVPFGCGKFLAQLGQPCHFNVEVVGVENPDDCTSAVVTQTSCGIQPIAADNWSKLSPLTFVGKTTSIYGETTSVAHLKLKTPNKIPELSPLWEDYEIGHVAIQIVKDTSSITYKSCSSTNDPYESTFDEIWYSLDVAGVFTMYKDESRNIEVQIETGECIDDGDGLFCTCGLAVRAGRTVFEISNCHSQTWNIGYTACGDNGDVLQVRRDWNWYLITLPTGVTMDIYLRTSDSLNVYLFPTVLDEGKSRGMCGVLSSTSDDDLTMRNGVITNSADEFAESWRVSQDENLFNPDVVRNGFSSYKPVYQYCTCDYSNSVDKTITCSATAASEVCKTADGFEQVNPKKCAISKRKKRRSQHQYRLVKRETNTQQTWKNGWNASAATDYCESQFAQSSSVQIAKDVPGVDVNRMKRECVEDIKKSGGTTFTAMAVAGVRMMALREAVVNPALSEANPNNPSAPSIFDQITLQTCQGDCSGRGTCNQGRCQCNAGYGGGDCSVDLTMPPVVYDAGDGGHCDLASEECVHTAVIGKVFSGNEDGKCRIEKHTIKQTGETETDVVTSSAAVPESISEVECTLPEINTDDVVVAFSISVSHSGDVYSNELPVLLYDSSCVTVNQDSRAWKLQEGYCIFKGKCHGIGSIRGDNPCLVCERDGGAQSWKQSSENGCPDGKLNIDDGNSASNVDAFQTRQVVILLLMTIAAILY